MKKLLVVSLFANLALVAYAVLKENIPDRIYYLLRRKGYLERKRSLSLIKGDSTMVMLTLGQSNASNSGGGRYKPKNKVYNYSEGNLFFANEPLIGTDGTGGSVWGRVGDILIDSGKFKKVIIIPIAEGGTNIQDWAEGRLRTKLTKCLSDLKKHNIKLTHVLYNQGESDVNTDKEEYKRRLGVIYRLVLESQNAPFFVSITSYNYLNYSGIGIDTAIQNAQKEFVQENHGVFLGPNTDTLCHAIHRFDGQHFSEYGLQRCAQAWYKAIVCQIE